MRNSIVWGTIVPVQTSLSSALEARVNLFQFDYLIKLNEEEKSRFNALISKVNETNGIVDIIGTNTSNGRFRISAYGSYSGMKHVSKKLKQEFIKVQIARLEQKSSFLENPAYESDDLPF